MAPPFDRDSLASYIVFLFLGKCKNAVALSIVNFLTAGEL
jgi:hypothetical protein